MSFEFNIVTSSGANLIANATAANPIVLIGALSSDTAASSKEDLASKDRSFYTGKAGAIFAASAQDNVARIIMAFNNQNLQNSQIIKSACVLGKLQSQNDSEAVIMAALSDNDSQISIPDETAPFVSIHIPINIAINADDDVATVGAEYASAADLARMVSCHKAGNPFAGDNQTILGDKTFTRPIHSATDEDSAFIKDFGDYSLHLGEMASVNYRYGDDSKDFLESGISFYSEDSDTHSILLSCNEDDGVIIRSFGLVSEAKDTSYEKVATTENQIRTRFFSGTECQSGCVVIKSIDTSGAKAAKIEAKVDFYDATTPFSEIYIDADNVKIFGLESAELKSEDNNENGVVKSYPGSIYLTIKRPSAVSSTIRFAPTAIDADITANNVHSFYPSKLGAADHKVTLGSSLAPWDNVYSTEFTGNFTGNLTGLIPTTSYSQDPKIGSIFMAYIVANSSSSAMGIGQDITASTGLGALSIHKGELSLDSGVVKAAYESSTRLQIGTYRLLSAIDGLSQGDSAVALVMRVS